MPSDDIAPSALAWEHSVRDIPESGLSHKRAADADERAAVARALDLVACASLEAEYTIVPSMEGRYHLAGTLRAKVDQACVVTLEPISNTIEERFEVAFWPAEDIPAPTSGVVDLDDELDPEPIVAGQIAVGRVVFECLTAAIDPFPRKPDATLDRTSTAPDGDDGGKPESPFAVLANLRPKD